MNFIHLLFGTQTNYGLIGGILVDLRDSIKLRVRVFREQL